MKMKPLDYRVFQVRMNMEQVVQPIVINQDTTINIHNCSLMEEDEDDLISDTEIDNLESEVDFDQHNAVYNTLGQGGLA